MVKATSQVVHEVLERCSLVVYQTRSISSDRDTGNTVKKGAKTVKEVVTTFDAGVLKAINAEKQKGARLCQQFGTKVESLAAWLVPNDRVEALLEGLTAIKDRVVVLTEDLASNIANLVESYALINPDQQDLIRTMGPGPEEVRKSTRILFAAYRVRPDEVVADAGGFSEDLELLHVQALHEFNMVLKDAKANPSGQYFTQGIRDVLGRIGMKANSLGFLHPVLAEIGRTIDDCLKNLPVDRYVDGYHAIALGSLLGQLMDPKLMLSQGGFKKLDFNQASQLTAQQEVAPKGRKKVVESVPLVQQAAVPMAATVDPVPAPVPTFVPSAQPVETVVVIEAEPAVAATRVAEPLVPQPVVETKQVTYASSPGRARASIASVVTF